MDARSKNQGLSLIELTIITALLAIIAGFASASLGSLVNTSRHIAIVNETQRMFSLARSYAVSRGTLTTICPLSSEQKCSDNWNAPISIFPDANNDKQPDNAVIYREVSLAIKGTTLYSRTAGRGYFQLAPDGMSHGTIGSIVACSSIKQSKFEMTYMALNMGGRLRILRDDDKDGVITLPWGTTTSCP